MKTKLFVLSFLLFINSKIILAQKEDYNWILTNNLKINFNQNPPLVTTDLPLLNGHIRNSCISDKYGNLLFYFDLFKVYNFNNNIIFNGTVTNGDNSVNIVPHPIESNKYFWLTSFAGAMFAKLYLYVIDMNANNGTGQVNFIQSIDSAYINVIVSQANSSYYWVVFWYSNKFVVYPLTDEGFGIGTDYNIETITNIEEFRVSPDMSKLFVIGDTILQVLDFNCQTGSVSNLRKILNYSSNSSLNFEYSRNGKFIYIAIFRIANFEFTVSQFSSDELSNETEFLNSEKIIYHQFLNNQFLCTDLQLAPDNKIYMSLNDYYLWAIENPDSIAPFCSVNSTALYLNGKKSGNYFPGFFYYYPSFGYNIKCNTSNFYYFGITVANVLWNFGDNETSTELYPTHTYTNAGYYNVSLTITYLNGEQKIVEKQITINQQPNNLELQQANNKDSVCFKNIESFNILNPISNSLFTWGMKEISGTILSGQGTSNIEISWSNKIGIDTLWVFSTNTEGCKSDTTKHIINILQLPQPIFSQTTNNDSVCVGNIENYKIQNSNLNSIFNWGVSENLGQIISGQNTDSINIEWLNTAGTETIWLFETNIFGCKSDTIKQKIYNFERPTAAISGTATLCNQNTNNEITITLNGISPFTLIYKINNLQNIKTIDAGNSFIITADQLQQTTNCELIKISDKLGCENTISGNATISIFPKLNTLKIKP